MPDGLNPDESLKGCFENLIKNVRGLKVIMREHKGEWEGVKVRHTTILGVKRGKEVAIAGDGQVTVGDMVIKQTAKKVRTLYHDEVIAGFAGAVADAITLFERFEGQLERHGGQLRRASVELAKEWRTDRMLRRLEAWLVVANKEEILVISGEGDVVEPDENVIGIGSGGGFAQAAALALMQHTELSAQEIARISMEIAAGLCIFTNRNITILSQGEKGLITQDVPPG
ncbi:MAG: ATP-dependent protease subunit HslV [Dehalococcoidia bacterium]|nr:ATP-dependent protease subunit HslV [Dehalococcoidia bacterium]MBF8304042.1 ATP-dependent protease subunit HslV [Dehalococcoidia bacterium]